MYDILIKNGTIFDGSGEKDGFIADIGITNGSIEIIGNLKASSAKTTIDAKGHFVSPGFIDILNHSDTYLTLFTIPNQNSLLSQGVTTIMGGNCGASLAPLVSGNAIFSVQRWTDPAQININWLRLSELFSVLTAQNKLAVNFGTLVGYGTIRKGVLRDEERKMTQQDIEIAGFLLEQAQEEGAFGMSSGLVYETEKDASFDEIRHMLAIIAKRKNIFSIHIRNEAEKLLDSLEEVINLAKETGAKVHISHFKAIGKDNWDKFQKALERMEKAKNQGVDLTFDMFPYASNGMTLYALLPSWAKDGSQKIILKRLQDQSERQKIEEDIKGLNLNYKKITIAALAGDKIFHGKTLEELSHSWGISPERAIINLLIGSGLKVIVFAHILNEENIQAGIKHPLSIIASDGAGYDLNYNKIGDLPHPRAFGAFSRFLRKYPNPKKQNIISYKEAIYKITGMPAKRFGIKQRGLIKTSYFADIVIFNPEKIEELTTFENPYQYSIGIKNVIINGNIAYDNGKYQDNFYGKVLKK